jgi:hypothetical protein
MRKAIWKEWVFLGELVRKLQSEEKWVRIVRGFDHDGRVMNEEVG